MQVACPHCSQSISLGADVLTSLNGASGFACPVCEGLVPLPDSEPAASETPARGRDFHPGGNWIAPDAAELARSFDARYRISRLLGRGGMGAVYEGFDTRLERRVAIKILPLETGQNPDALARFEREAKAMAALDHPNIVHIHDFGSTPDGHPFLVMEFIDGMDVHRLRQSGHLDLPGALDLISQVCAALQYAHTRGIVHRDIKPANILVSREGVAKVADFGLAKILGTDSHPQCDPGLTRSGAAMGTLDYMAPEQMEGHHVDHRADIYSLGVMLYDLLTGAPPRGAWPPPSERVQIDVRLDEIVLRALQQNPSARYQAAGEVKGDIDSVKSSTGGGPLPPGVEPEPLPSSRPGGAIATAHRTTTAPGGSARSTPSAPVTDADEFIATTRSLNTTMFVLGLLAIGLIGGLALYLANRKPGDNITTETVITTSETHNTFATQLVAGGVTTAKELEAISDIRSFGAGFIGLSKEPLDWAQAQDLAKRTGAEILSADETGFGWWQSLSQWLRTSYPTQLATAVWILENREPRVLESFVVQSAKEMQTPRRVLLQWGAEEKVESPPPPPIASGQPAPLPVPEISPEAPLPPTPQPIPPVAVEPVNPPPASGLVSWINRDGIIIQAEFVRLDGESVVIRWKDKESKIAFSKLSPASVAQAKQLGATAK